MRLRASSLAAIAVAVLLAPAPYPAGTTIKGRAAHHGGDRDGNPQTATDWP